MSDLGRGFKTKILDAIMSDCFVILTEESYMRLPVEVMPYCVPYNPTRESFEAVLEKIDRPFPQKFNLNQHLKDQAYQSMDGVFAVDGPNK
jgi:hypothetical protein